MKEFKTIQDIHTERESQRGNKIIYNLLGVLIGELDRLPTRKSPTADDIYKQIVKLYNNAKEMSLYKQESMDEFNYLNDFIKKQLTEDELNDVIKGYIDEGFSNIGSIMRQLNTFYKGQFDGKMANVIIGKYLNK